MTTRNRLAVTTGENPNKVSVYALERLAADLNSEWWVRHMGRHYFVSRTENPKYVSGSPDPKEREFVHQLAWTVAK